ncbi:AraC family ligand binding domain-containing protein [Roseibium salinum]|nr:AraC family ligand binding domain-containing protein [Roseibium salinum]
MASGAGYELRVNEVYSWDGLQRGDIPFVLIQHTIAGEGRLDYEGTRHVLLPGRTMLLTFPHANRYYLERGRSWEYFWIILSGREALRLAGAILAVEGPVVTPAVAAVDRLAGACLALLSGTADTPGAVSASAYSAMATLYDEAIGAVTGYADLPAAVLRAQRFVAENLGRKIDVAMLAQAAGLSRAHFVRMFTGAVGGCRRRTMSSKSAWKGQRACCWPPMPLSAPSPGPADLPMPIIFFKGFPAGSRLLARRLPRRGPYRAAQGPAGGLRHLLGETISETATNHPKPL